MRIEKGDIVLDIVNEWMWIVTSINYCDEEDDYKYEIASIKNLSYVAIVNERVITYMRADYIKRTKKVLDKTSKQVII